jgi:hypothetical protein
VEIVFSKVAGIDVHKRQVTVAVRVPDDACDSGGEPRAQKVRRFATFYGALMEMAEWLRAEQVTHSNGGHWGVLAASISCTGRSRWIRDPAMQRPPRQECARSQVCSAAAAVVFIHATYGPAAAAIDTDAGPSHP